MLLWPSGPRARWEAVTRRLKEGRHSGPCGLEDDTGACGGALLMVRAVGGVGWKAP